MYTGDKYTISIHAGGSTSASHWRGHLVLEFINFDIDVYKYSEKVLCLIALSQIFKNWFIIIFYWCHNWRQLLGNLVGIPVPTTKVYCVRRIPRSSHTSAACHVSRVTCHVSRCSALLWVRQQCCNLADSGGCRGHTKLDEDYAALCLFAARRH